MKRSNITKALLIACFGLGFTTQALADNCLTGTMAFAGSAGHYYAPLSLSIKNMCSTPMNLNGMKVQFNNNGAPIGSVWGDYAATNLGQNGFTLKSYSDSTRLAVGATASIKFGVNLNNQPFNLSGANSSLTLNGASSGAVTPPAPPPMVVPPDQVIDTPAPAGCVSGTFASVSDANNKWYTGATLKITNNCSSAVNLDHAAVSFNSNATGTDGPWYPFKGSNAGVKNGAVNFTLSSQNPAASSLGVGASVNLTMGIYLNNAAFSLTNANSSLKVVPVGGNVPAVNDGAITVTINPAGMTNIAAGTEGLITINSPALANPIVIKNTLWNQTTTHTYQGLNYDTYTVSAGTVANYAGNATPASVTLTSSTPKAVTVSYALIPAKGTVNVTMPVKPIGNLTNAGVTVNVKDMTTGQTTSKTINFNQNGVFSDLIAGDMYQVSTTPASLSDGIQTATPVFSTNDFTLAAGSTHNVTVSYQVTQNTTYPVSFNVSGLSNEVPHVTLNLTNLQGNRIGPLSLNNGANAVQLPANTYTVDVAASPLSAKVDKTTITIPQISSVAITVSEPAAFTPVLGAYWAGWMGYQYDLNGTYGNLPITDLYLAFANYANGKIDTSVSGWYGDVPVANSQIQPTYQNWTTYAYNHPNVKIIMSLGGATFGQMWHNLNSMNDANAMTQAVITALSTQYPVYAAAWGNPQVAYAINQSTPLVGSAYGSSYRMGYVDIDGVDLDVEVSGAAEMARIAPYLVQIMQSVHQALPTKAISVAVFSVGGDPAGACTVSGSAHCGEALPLIQAVNADPALKNIVTYNVMAYDAGVDFVLPTANNGGNPLYRTAMQNYVTAVGDPSKVILGLDLQRQWGVPSPETCEQLADKAQWAYQHPDLAGGTFLWEIGDDSNACKALPALQGMANEMP